MLTLGPDLLSVGRARAAVTEAAKAWRCPTDLVEDAKLVVSELMSNGVLHARTELCLVISQVAGGGLRLEVHDESSAPVLPSPGVAGPSGEVAGASFLAPVLDEAGVPGATGRGLAVVGALASSWGWSPNSGGGKVVWAELGAPVVAGEVPDGSFSERPPHPLRPARLIAAPLRLLKASEDQLDDLFRELQMAHLARETPSGPEPRPGGGAPDLVDDVLFPLAQAVKMRVARMREPLRRAIWDAVHRGDRLVDLSLLADEGVQEAFDAAQRLLSEAALAARKGLLLTGPPTAEVVEWRRWLRREIEDQVRGMVPRACPFPVVPTDHRKDGLAHERLDSARQEALEELRAILAGGPATGGPATGGPATGDPATGDPATGDPATGDPATGDPVLMAALRSVVRQLSASRCVLCTLGDDNETVHFGASVGFSPIVVDYWQASSLSADLPASEVIRTGRPLFFRTFAELDERYPIFLSTPAESDPALACIPLLEQATDECTGCLVVGFKQARDFSPREVSFLKEVAAALAAVVAQRRQQREVKEAAALRRGLEAEGRLIGSAPTVPEALARLAEAVTRLVAEGAAVHRVAEDGSIRFVAARHRDPARQEAAVNLLRREAVTSGDSILARCARTGEVLVVQTLSEEALAAGGPSPEDLELLRALALGSVASVPVKLGPKVLGVVSLSNSAGRFIEAADVAHVEQLAARAASTVARLGPYGP